MTTFAARTPGTDVVVRASRSTTVSPLSSLATSALPSAVAATPWGTLPATIGDDIQNGAFDATVRAPPALTAVTRQNRSWPGVIGNAQVVVVSVRPVLVIVRAGSNALDVDTSTS